jgi:transcriptional regulator with XRE-family HTH domain
MADTSKAAAVNSSLLTTAIHDFGTAKQVARVARCSEPTAARYRRGDTMPDPVRLARLMGASDAVATAILTMAGLGHVAVALREARLEAELDEIRARRGLRKNDGLRDR